MTKYKSLLQIIGANKPEAVKHAFDTHSLELTVIMNNTTTFFQNFINASSKLTPYLKDEASKQNLTLITTKVSEAMHGVEELNTEIVEHPQRTELLKPM